MTKLPNDTTGKRSEMTRLLILRQKETRQKKAEKRERGREKEQDRERERWECATFLPKNGERRGKPFLSFQL